MKMSLLERLSMVTLGVGQAKEALLQEVTARISTFAILTVGVDLLLSIPESKGDVLVAMRIRDTCDAVLTPAEGA